MGKTEDTLAQLTANHLEGIDREIERLEKLLEKTEPIREKRDQLRAARRALTGGNRLTGSAGARIRQEDVVQWLRDHPGTALAAITEGVGGTTTQISSHLNRGKNERFLNWEGRWWVRDPKNGLNEEEDCKQWLRKQVKEEQDTDIDD